jgi:hypothetical protein
MSQVRQAKKPKQKWNGPANNPGGFVWFTGFIGAFIYYVEQAGSFGEGTVAFLKALVWPAFLVYKLLG